METILRILASALRAIIQTLIALLLLIPYLLLWLLRALGEFLELFFGREPNEPAYRDPCFVIPEHIRRKPDPCLYSQEFILANYPGVPVTWNNPDIWITEPDETPVDPHKLEPDHTYFVFGRIWNASFDPAIGTSVRCRYRSFGFSAPTDDPVQTNPDGSEMVVVLHIGAWQNEVARFTWTTPKSEGHYCLLVSCDHDDDAQPGNNVGQHNTDVVAGAPGETVTVSAMLSNPDSGQAQRLKILADTYQIPSGEIELELETRVQSLGSKFLPSPFRDEQPVRSSLKGSDRWTFFGSRGPTYVAYVYRGLEKVVERNKAVPKSIPANWNITAGDAALEQLITLGPGETRAVELSITIPATAQPGSSVSFNFTATDERARPFGGVTIQVEVRS